MADPLNISSDDALFMSMSDESDTNDAEDPTGGKALGRGMHNDVFKSRASRRSHTQFGQDVPQAKVRLTPGAHLIP